eukprot:6175049-Pleurochrysis_carterae.AAC.3
MRPCAHTHAAAPAALALAPSRIDAVAPLRRATEPRKIVSPTSPPGADCHRIASPVPTITIPPDSYWKRLSSGYCWHSSTFSPRASVAAGRRVSKPFPRLYL